MNPSSEKTTIYVLALADGCYYVGRTSNWDRRLAEHESGEGSTWTRIHPLQEVVETFEGDALDEDKTVKKYMLSVGIDKVRGGSYSSIKLSGDQLRSLELEFRGASDGCFRCGKRGHFAKDCQSYYNLEGMSICRRCDRLGHKAADCYAKTHKNGHVFGSRRPDNQEPEEVIEIPLVDPSLEVEEPPQRPPPPGELPNPPPPELPASLIVAAQELGNIVASVNKIWNALW